MVLDPCILTLCPAGTTCQDGKCIGEFYITIYFRYLYRGHNLFVHFFAKYIVGCKDSNLTFIEYMSQLTSDVIELWYIVESVWVLWGYLSLANMQIY